MRKASVEDAETKKKSFSDDLKIDAGFFFMAFSFTL